MNRISQRVQGWTEVTLSQPSWTSGLGSKILVSPIMLLVADIRLPHHHSLGLLQLSAIDRTNLPTSASLQETHIGTKPCSDGRWRRQRKQRVDLDSESSLFTFGLLSSTFHTKQGWHAAKPVGIRNWVFREKSKSLFLISIICSNGDGPGGECYAEDHFTASEQETQGRRRNRKFN